MRAKMAATYGWTHIYIKSLPISVFMDYWLAITPIEAREMLNDMNVSAYPHISKKPDRQKFLSSVKQMANASIKKDGNGVKSIKDVYHQLARKLSGNGNN